jgi:hypothetical protein
MKSMLVAAHEGARRGTGRPHSPQIAIQDGAATSIAGLFEALEDDGTGSAGVLLEQISDQGLERIEFAGAGTVGRQRRGSPEILFHGASRQMEMAGDAAHRPMLALGEPMDFIDLVCLQHGSGYKPQPLAKLEGCCWQEAGSTGTGEPSE